MPATSTYKRPICAINDSLELLKQEIQIHLEGTIQDITFEEKEKKLHAFFIEAERKIVEEFCRPGCKFTIVGIVEIHGAELIEASTRAV